MCRRTRSIRVRSSRKFISCVMHDGKRSTAERILYKSFDIIKEKTGDDPLKVFKKAIDNVKPSLEVKSRRVGGSNYQVPVEVNPNRRLSLSIRWIVGYASRAAARRCRRSWRTNSSTRRTCAAAPSRNAKTRTGWPRPTRRSRTIAGKQDDLRRSWSNSGELAGPNRPVTKSPRLPNSRISNAQAVTVKQNAEHRHHGPHRCREDDHHGADPVLHRELRTKSARCTKAPP